MNWWRGSTARWFRGTAAEFVHRQLANARNGIGRAGSRAIWSNPTSRTARGLRDCIRLYWIAKYVYRVRETDECSNAAYSMRRKYAPSAAAPIPVGRSAATSISSRPAGGAAVVRYAARDRIRLGYTSHPGMQDVERFMKHYFLVAKDVGDLTAILCAKLEDQQAKPASGAQPHDGAPRPNTKRVGCPTARFHYRQQPHQPGRADVFQARPGQPDPDFPARQKNNLAFHPDAMRTVTRSLKLITFSCARIRKPTGCSWKS